MHVSPAISGGGHPRRLNLAYFRISPACVSPTISGGDHPRRLNLAPFSHLDSTLAPAQSPKGLSSTLAQVLRFVEASVRTYQIVGDFRGKSRRPALKFGSHAHALSSSSSRSNSSDMRDRSFCSSRTSARLESSAAGGAVASGRCACFARCSVWSSAEAADACTSSCRNDTGGAVASGRCCVCSARCSAWSARRGCAGPRRSPISAFQFIVPWTYELQRDLCCRAGAWTGYVTLLTECAAWLCWVAEEAAGVPISSLSAEGREASILFCSFLAFANGVIFLRPMSLRWLQQSTRSSTDSSSTEKRPRSCCGVVGGHIGGRSNIGLFYWQT